MIEALSLRLENVVYFKDAYLDITKHPFTVISGHNADSRISANTNNGAGKSLLWSAFPNLRYDSTPLGVGKKRKDMLSKNSSITIPIRAADGKVYTIIQEASKFTILRDGVDLESRTVPLQRKKIEEIFPITEDEFYSYVYLQSQRPLSFQIDKPAARLQYLTSMFNLEAYDQLKKYFTRKLGEIKNKQVEFDVLNAQLIKVNGLMERLDWSKEKAEKLESARSVISGLGDSAKKLQTRIERLKSAQAVITQYVKLKEQRLAITPELDRKEAKRQLELHEAVSEYKSDVKSYKAQRQLYTRQLEEIGSVDSVKKLERKVKKLIDHQSGEEASLSILHEARQNYKQIVRELEAATAELKSLGVSTKKVSSYLAFGADSYEMEIARHSAVIQLESIVSDCADGECPTCQQNVNVKKFKKQIKEAKAALAKAKHGLEVHAVCLEVDRLRTRAKKHEFDAAAEQQFLERRAAYKENDALLESIQDQLRSARQAEKITEALNGLKAPKAPKEVPEFSTKVLTAVLEQHTEIKRLDSVLQSIEDQHGELDAVTVAVELKAASSKYEKIERKYIKAQDVCSKLGSKASEYKVLRRERKDALTALEDIKPIIAQRDLYKTLEKAYSSKGLKVVAANKILSQIEQNLNQYSNLIFAEPFKFQLEAAADGVHCIVDRGNGKRSDVRMLSGAESDCFRLLWMWVMLIMADDQRRTNFVVLDEPDAHMDETTRSLLIERFIPALRSLVPHVFLITPKDKHSFRECAYLTVVKSKGVSKLVENFDDSGGIRMSHTGTGVSETKQRKRTKKKSNSDTSA